MRSTRSRDRKEAQKIADVYEKPYHQRMKARQIQRVMRDLCRDVAHDEGKTTTLSAYMNDWLTAKEPEVSPATITFYRSKTNQFLNFMGDKKDKDLFDVDKEDILRFRQEELKRIGRRTINHALKFLRGIFKSAKRDGYIVDDPCEFVETVKQGDKQVRRAFTIPEIKTLLQHCDPEWTSMVKFGLYTGQRLGDISRLRWEAIDLDNEEIRFVTGKTGRRMNIPICRPLKEHIISLPSSDDPQAPIHPRACNLFEKEGRASSVSRAFGEILMDAGLIERQKHRKVNKGESRQGKHKRNDISFHALRHTTVSMMKNAGISPAIVQEFVGHDSEEVSALYTHIEKSAMKKSADKVFTNVLK
jgi:integrase